MDIRLDRLPDPTGEGLNKKPFEWQEEISVSADEIHPDVTIPGRVTCRGKIRSVTSGLLLQAQLSYEQQLTCTRCLTTVLRPVTSEVDLFLRIDPQAHTEAEERKKSGAGEPEPELELGEDDLGVLILPTPNLSTRPIIAEQLEIDLPMKVLCRDDCAGLCGKCGADLNLGPCDCAGETDPRWGALAQLKNS